MAQVLKEKKETASEDYLLYVITDNLRGYHWPPGQATINQFDLAKLEQHAKKDPQEQARLDEARWILGDAKIIVRSVLERGVIPLGLHSDAYVIAHQILSVRQNGKPVVSVGKAGTLSGLPKEETRSKLISKALLSKLGIRKQASYENLVQIEAALRQIPGLEAVARATEEKKTAEEGYRYALRLYPSGAEPKDYVVVFKKDAPRPSFKDPEKLIAWLAKGLESGDVLSVSVRAPNGKLKETDIVRFREETIAGYLDDLRRHSAALNYSAITGDLSFRRFGVSNKVLALRPIPERRVPADEKQTASHLSEFLAHVERFERHLGDPVSLGGILRLAADYRQLRQRFSAIGEEAIVLPENSQARRDFEHLAARLERAEKSLAAACSRFYSPSLARLEREINSSSPESAGFRSAQAGLERIDRVIARLAEIMPEQKAIQEIGTRISSLAALTEQKASQAKPRVVRVQFAPISGEKPVAAAPREKPKPAGEERVVIEERVVVPSRKTAPKPKAAARKAEEPRAPEKKAAPAEEEAPKVAAVISREEDEFARIQSQVVSGELSLRAAFDRLAQLSERLDKKKKGASSKDKEIIAELEQRVVATSTELMAAPAGEAPKPARKPAVAARPAVKPAAPKPKKAEKPRESVEDRQTRLQIQRYERMLEMIQKRSREAKTQDDLNLVQADLERLEAPKGIGSEQRRRLAGVRRETERTLADRGVELEEAAMAKPKKPSAPVAEAEAVTVQDVLYRLDDLKADSRELRARMERARKSRKTTAETLQQLRAEYRELQRAISEVERERDAIAARRKKQKPGRFIDPVVSDITSRIVYVRRYMDGDLKKSYAALPKTAPSRTAAKPTAAPPAEEVAAKPTAKKPEPTAAAPAEEVAAKPTAKKPEPTAKAREPKKEGGLPGLRRLAPGTLPKGPEVEAALAYQSATIQMGTHRRSVSYSSAPSYTLQNGEVLTGATIVDLRPAGERKGKPVEIYVTYEAEEGRRMKPQNFVFLISEIELNRSDLQEVLAEAGAVSQLLLRTTGPDRQKLDRMAVLSFTEGQRQRIDTAKKELDRLLPSAISTAKERGLSISF